MNKSSELENTKYIKNVLMFVIVLYHCFLLLVDSTDAVSYFIVLDIFKSFEVNTFVIVSGYLFAYILYERGGYDSFKKFFVNKSKRLIIPYIFVCSCWAAPIVRFTTGYGLFELTYKYILGIDADQLWFLLMLFELFMLEYWLIKVKLKWIYRIVGVIVVYIVGVYLKSDFYNVWRVFDTLKMLIFFELGIYLYKKRDGAFYKKDRILFCGVLTLFLLCVLEFYKTIIAVEVKFDLIETIIEMFLGISASIFMWTILQIIFNKSRHNIILKTASSVSMGVFLVHQQIIYLIRYFLGTGVWMRFSCIVYIFVSFVVTMTISILITCLLKSNSVTRFLIGEKV